MSKVSVFMPVYNSARFLDDSIQSILAQTFSYFNLIIINDGSTDNSLDIIKKYQQADKRITVVDRAHRGTAVTRNEGLALAKGEYLALIDSDDKIHPKRLSKQIDFLDNNKNIVACGTMMKQFGEKSSVVKQPLDPDIIKIALLFSPSISNATAMMRLSKVVENKITYKETDFQSQDYRFWAKVSQIGQISNINEVLYYYRSHPTQATQANRHNQIRIHKEIVAELLQKIGIQLTDQELSFFLLDEFRGEETPGVNLNLTIILPTIIDIFNRLIYANDKILLFNKEKLARYLCLKYENICLLFGLRGIKKGTIYENETIKIRSGLLLTRLLSRSLKGGTFLDCA